MTLTTMEYATETSNPVKLGVGSFGRAFTIQGGPIAFKEILQNTRLQAEILRQEFLTLQVIYDTCRADAFFALPRPFSFSDPDAVEVQFLSDDVLEPDSTQAIHQRLSTHPPYVSQGLMSMFSTPTYSMDRVFALPMDVGAFVARSFFPPGPRDSGARPRICRLYFGKEYQGPPSRFFSTENFPLDATRYTAIHEQFPAVSYPAEDVARGMGEMLARMHFRAGVDARDVEFVLGSCGDSRLSYTVIDFNQVHHWPKGDDVSQLVSAFFDNDPYFPRPTPEAKLYIQFKEGYLDACSPEDRHFGVRFIEAIEKEESSRAARRQMPQDA